MDNKDFVAIGLLILGGIGALFLIWFALQFSLRSREHSDMKRHLEKKEDSERD